MFKDLSAAELADRFDYLLLTEPNTAFASMLDEAALSFARKSSDVALACGAFSSARSAHQRAYRPASGDYAPEAWSALVNASRSLSRALRTLGDMTIARCPKCTVPLDDDGSCRYDLCPQNENGA